MAEERILAGGVLVLGMLWRTFYRRQVLQG